MDHTNVTLSAPELLRAFEHRAKKRFGQHFLVDPRILGQIADDAKVQSGDKVVEIGPGCGTLTVTMLQRGATVKAFEIDRDAIAFLQQMLVPRFGLEIVEGDVLRQPLAQHIEGPGWKCVANLPYNVATEIYFRLMELAPNFSCLVLMFQREVAWRFVARVGDDGYGVLSLMCQLYCDAELTRMLPPGAFVPPPKVHSAIVRFVPIVGTRIADDRLRRAFVRAVKTSFSARRKTMPNALRGASVEKDVAEAALRHIGRDVRVRPEELNFEEFRALAAFLLDAGQLG